MNNIELAGLLYRSFYGFFEDHAPYFSEGET